MKIVLEMLLAPRNPKNKGNKKRYQLDNYNYYIVRGLPYWDQACFGFVFVLRLFFVHRHVKFLDLNFSHWTILCNWDGPLPSPLFHLWFDSDDRDGPKLPLLSLLCYTYLYHYLSIPTSWSNFALPYDPDPLTNNCWFLYSSVVRLHLQHTQGGLVACQRNKGFPHQHLFLSRVSIFYLR